jgi:exo-beta-1,3-glucanase (GH17 family)
MYTQAAQHSTTNVDLNPGQFTEPGYRATDQWVEKSQTGSKRSKWIVIGSVLALLGLIAIGVTVGVVVSRNNNSKSSSKSNPSSSGSGGSPTPQTDPNDPSTFIKDSKLHQSFYAFAYTPAGSQLPDCGNNLSDVIQDIQILSQLTKRLRLYGADCNQSALVLEAIKQTKVDMTVYLGNYVIATDNGAAYQRQRDVIKSAIETYGTDHIEGITVGNEFMLNYLNANGGGDANSATGNAGAAILLAFIKDTRDMLASLNLGKNIPVGNSDAGAFFNNEVLANVDYGMANVHPWFANVSAETGAAWTAQFFQTTNVDVANTLPNKPKMYIAETGWPTKSSDAANANNGPSLASEANLQIFLNTFVCQANTNNTGYFFFEFLDEPWKDAQFGGVEGWWGLFTSNRTLKNIEIPDCPSP